MQVKKLTVRNFRNYKDSVLELDPVRNLLIGENAQGKTNLLEAIEILSNVRHTRAGSDRELILRGESETLIEVQYLAQGIEESASLILRLNPRLSRTIKLNGVKQTRAEMGGRLSRLTAVSFSSQDLTLLRGGPKERRDWLDDVVLKLRPGLYELPGKYEKIVAQRNRLLKTIFEGNRPHNSYDEELRVWDVQLCRFGARLIKSRVEVLNVLLPQAEENLRRVSGLKEKLSATYDFREEFQEGEEGERLPLLSILNMENEDLAKRMYLSLKARRAEEIARRQTLTGPHRDDITFAINDFSATAFASQGQQRSLVLSLKLAELKLVEDALSEPPLLLLDDVLAELDLSRQGMLMDLVKKDMQTLITTTHLDGFRPEWLTGARITRVSEGSLAMADKIAD